MNSGQWEEYGNRLALMLKIVVLVAMLLVFLAAMVGLIRSASAFDDCPMTKGTECRERADIGPEERNFDSEAAGIIDSEVDRVMVPPTTAEAEDIKRWIPFMCCRSNSCCRKVRADSLAPLGDGRFQVLDTGQEKAYHRWSQDGQVWRCACDWDDKKSKWIVHPGARTRCIFPIPMLGKISGP